MSIIVASWCYKELMRISSDRFRGDRIEMKPFTLPLPEISRNENGTSPPESIKELRQRKMLSTQSLDQGDRPHRLPKRANVPADFR